MAEQRKRVIITAGCGGIGGELTRYLLKCGYEVIPTTRDLKKSVQFLNTLEPELKLHCEPMQLNLDTQNKIDAFVHKAAIRYDKINALINCAIYSHAGKDPYEMDIEKWDQYYRVNVFGTACLTAKVVEQLIRRDGAVVNFSSFYSVNVPDNRVYEGDGEMIPASLIYASSKAALNYVTQYMAVRYAEKNITVNAILPGGVRDRARQTDSFAENYCYRTPMKRMAHIDEFNKAVEFFLSENSRYCTGQLLAIDGGWGLL